MCASELVKSYIERQYQNWLKYAKYRCGLSRLQIEPTEVLNHVLYSLLESDQVRLERLINSPKNDRTELDYLVFHNIKISVISPRSSFRYVKGQNKTCHIEEYMQIASDVSDDDKEFNPGNRLEIVRRELIELDIPDSSKRIFAWRFFEGQSYSTWQGPESLKCLYDTYNRVSRAISAKIRRKQRC